jgi:hypothetical protein
MRTIAHSLLGVLGVLLVLYLGNKAHYVYLATANVLDSSIIVLSLACVALLAAAVSNFAVAYALTLGRVSAVRGSRDCAALFDKTGNHISTAAIKFSANLDRSSAHKSIDRQQVIFIADWRPRSCSVSTFLV